MAARLCPVDLDFASVGRPINVPDPTTAQQAATKAYVDARTPKITVGTSAPGSPAVGDLWIDTN